MAATAHPTRNADVAVVDDMDMHSDNGIDFGDGDIDLDLEPTLAPAVQNQDDDVSIHDAASVNSQEAHNAPVEQDDFMADTEDLIEEDVVLYDEEEEGRPEAEHDDTTFAIIYEADATVPVDEDLVDYSDDEDNGPVVHDNIALEEHDVDEVEANAQSDVLAETADSSRGIVEADKDTQQSPQADIVQDEVVVESNQEQPQISVQSPGANDSDEEHHTDGDDGGVLLSESKDVAVHAQNESDDQHDEAYTDDDENNAFDEHEAQNVPTLQSVTVNYAGNELWLFKDHDPDESGDWLLEDLTLAKSTMSDLFRACRSSLGDDVSHEHEIGFRFDHLHNLELYEDNTACVAVSLERLVELHHTLQLQDGIAEPESFYVSLLFRPRFATLLSDVAKFAEQGSGYSALNAAVVAGDTHFTNVFSGASTDEPTEWDNGESEGDDVAQSHNASPDDQAQHDEDSESTETHEGGSGDGHSPGEDDTYTQAEESNEAAWNAELEEASVDTSSVKSLVNDHIQTAEQSFEDLSEPTADNDALQNHEEEGDLIDYGDEDGVQDEDTENVVADEHSQSSLTVQGDDSETAQDTHGSTQHTQTEEQEDHDNSFAVAVGEEDEISHEDQQAHHSDGAAQSYQDYVQDPEDNDLFQGYQQEGIDLDLAVSSHLNNDANLDYTGSQYHDMNQETHADFTLDPDFNDDGNTATFDDDFTATDDLQSFDNAPEWNNPVDPASNTLEDVFEEHDVFGTTEDGDEGGAAEATALATSSAADHVTVSSQEVKDMSPQGQKRSVDEAGHGTDDALELTDVKRPRM